MPRRQGGPPVLRAGIGTMKMTPTEVITDRAATYPGVLEELARRPGTAPTGTPTTASSATTAG